MKIYLSHSGNFDYVNELYRPIQGSNLMKQCDFFFPHDQQELVDARKIIKNFDLILAEVSFPSTGQGIELGWAKMLSVPIACFSRKDAKPSLSLQFVTNEFITYVGSADLIAQLSDFLKARV